jgi:hypothetical protein
MTDDISLHVVTRLRGVTLLAIAADRALGRTVHLLLLHDEVYRAGGDRVPPCDRVLVGADDCRRRGLALPDGAVEYPEIVEAIANAAHVVSW